MLQRTIVIETCSYASTNGSGGQHWPCSLLLPTGKFRVGVHV